tara:strand:- start:5115 stop:5339 length:225 start_codon:yes stop_codon:yes gene_type:complete
MKKGFLKWIFTNPYFYITLVIWSLIGVINQPSLSMITLLINIPIMILFLFIPFAIIGFILKDKDKKEFPIKNWK